MRTLGNRYTVTSKTTQEAANTLSNTPKQIKYKLQKIEMDTEVICTCAWTDTIQIYVYLPIPIHITYSTVPDFFPIVPIAQSQK